MMTFREYTRGRFLSVKNRHGMEFCEFWHEITTNFGHSTGRIRNEYTKSTNYGTCSKKNGLGQE